MGQRYSHLKPFRPRIKGCRPQIRLYGSQGRLLYRHRKACQSTRSRVAELRRKTLKERFQFRLHIRRNIPPVKIKPAFHGREIIHPRGIIGGRRLA